MTSVPDGVQGDLPLRDVAVALARSRAGVLPVIDADGEYVGVVTARVVAEALADGRHDAAPASLVLELPLEVRTEDHLDEAIEALDRSGCAAVPVFESKGLAGRISYAMALKAMPARYGAAPVDGQSRSGCADVGRPRRAGLPAAEG